MRVFRRVAVVALLVALAVGVVVFGREGTGDLVEMLKSVQPVALIPLAIALPMVGFPVTVLYFALGARFGFALGLAIVVPCTFAHVAIGVGLSGWVRKPVAWLLERGGWTLRPVPGGARSAFAAWLALIPGLSYTLKNYVIPMAGVSLRTALLVVAPIHVLGAVVGLLLGGAVRGFSWSLVVVAVLYALSLLLATHYMLGKLRREKAMDDVTPVPENAERT